MRQRIPVNNDKFHALLEDGIKKHGSKCALARAMGYQGRRSWGSTIARLQEYAEKREPRVLDRLAVALDISFDELLEKVRR